ncbi:MAG: type II secretion system protein [Thiobacillus sp.]|uniref:type II secretion system protein n=1 Tax=Thiobacillus sp. TaxID=924 RepID=UPI002895CD30|nr:type II secretion system protein [Thiobacillus sp.]MDT3708043.1 type II secretion system protein [Thiobacillus sp.]
MKRAQGFTLIELAIVLVILTIMIGGLAVPLSAQIQARRVADTNRTLEEAREVIIGYAMSHKTAAARPYLPCPDADGDGHEDARSPAGACLQNQGWFPWVTLGAASQDAWGNRLRYRVTGEFANSETGIPSGDGDLRLCSASGCAKVDVADHVPVVLISHGPNGRGALNVNGNTMAAPSSVDEQENTDDDPDFVSRIPARADHASGEFDDLAVWISADLLRSRVCPAGGCP